MTTQNHEMLCKLMENGSDGLLIQIRDGYIRELPLESIHPADREIVEMINEYFESKDEIDD